MFPIWLSSDARYISETLGSLTHNIYFLPGDFCFPPQRHNSNDDFIMLNYVVTSCSSPAQSNFESLCSNEGERTLCQFNDCIAAICAVPSLCHFVQLSFKLYRNIIRHLEKTSQGWLLLYTL